MCIDTECFYIISSDEDSVTMLAKYNLYTGGIYDNNSKLWAAYENEATGIQDSTMIGGYYDTTIRNGTSAFSPTVYNSNSYAYIPLENYKKYLQSKNVVIEEVRLISFEELKLLGCDDLEYVCVDLNFSWVYATNYFSGTALDMEWIWYVSNTAGFGHVRYDNNEHYGIRPVITIPLSEFQPI